MTIVVLPWHLGFWGKIAFMGLMFAVIAYLLLAIDP